MIRIVINEGDEYRAKIEEKFVADLFFLDVYKRAGTVVRELLREYPRLHEETKRESYQQNDFKYYRVGNNIISFCASRGQGKTSVMKSFSKYLETGRDNGELKYDFEANFIALDSIDPSALNHNESIVRVFISRLFYKLSEIMKNAMKEKSIDNHFKQRRAEIFKLFQQCFDNIDYLDNNKKPDWDIDDMEFLAQLGDSGRLRENLYNLVEEFLGFVKDYQIDCGEKKYKSVYLILPIDDADLSVGNIFKICEDIRNYFSIPNMIVLMAADMEQLTCAIEREYVIRYKELIGLKKEHNYYQERCNKMANRYMEKMFPAGHRLELPKFSEVLQNSHEEIVIYYKFHSGDEIFRIDELCKNMQQPTKNMQQQLTKMLYARTGIILLDQEVFLHIFLPHTFREMTHFVKLLLDMREIDFTEACSSYRENGNSENIDRMNLIENLERMEQYFFDFWCENRLNDKNQKVFWEIAEEHRMNREEAIVTALEKYYSDNYFVDSWITPLIFQYDKLFEAGGEELIEAICLLHTIIMHKKFVYSLGDADRLEKLSEDWQIYVDNLTPECNEKSLDGYHIDKYEVSMENIKKDASEGDEIVEDNVWIRQFCSAAAQDGDKPSEDLLFNAFHNLLLPMRNDGNWGSQKEGKELQEEPKTEDSDNASIDDVAKQTEKTKKGVNIDKVNTLLSIKDIFCNAEVYFYVSEALRNFYSHVRTTKIGTLNSLYKDLYGVLDKWMSACVPYLSMNQKEDYGLGKFCINKYMENSTLASLVFFSNQDNRKVYTENLTDLGKKQYDLLQQYINRLSGALERAELNLDILTEPSTQMQESFDVTYLSETTPIQDAEDIKKAIGEIQSCYENLNKKILDTCEGYQQEIGSVTELAGKMEDLKNSISELIGEAELEAARIRRDHMNI